MDWSDLGSKVMDMAPALGSALGGPAGGAAGAALASVFGTEDDPDQIAKAIEQDPEAAAKLRKAELKHEREMARIEAERESKRESEVTARQAAVSDTMQIGYKQGVLWRRAVGWSLAIVIPLVVLGVLGIAGAAIYMDRPQLIQHIPAVLSALGPVWYVYMAVLGIAGWQEGKMGRALAGDSEGGLAKTIKAIKSQ